MTVPNETSRIDYVYTGPATYDFDFKIIQATDLLVAHIATDATATIFVYSTDYTVSLAADGTGSITTIPASPTDGTLRIGRNIPITQNVDWVNNNGLDLEIVERSFDKDIMIIQQLRDTVNAGALVPNWRGEWATGIAYVAGDLITTAGGSQLYTCIQSHTAGTFSTDKASGYWYLALSLSAVTEGIPAGGSTGYQLTKTSGDDYDVDWTAPSGYVSRQIFTGSGTWTKPSGVTKVIAKVVGGGGGAGGSVSAGASQSGGAGGYTEEEIDVSAIASETVTIGAAGTGGVGANAGGDGGTSSFGSHCSATGGTGGAHLATTGGDGGTGSGGDINMTGGAGSYSTGACGGNSIFGGGGKYVNAGNGGDAGAYGAGGGSPSADATRTGGDGMGGIIIVEEYA
jgi:hypothetical protein